MTHVVDPVEIEEEEVYLTIRSIKFHDQFTN